MSRLTLVKTDSPDWIKNLPRDSLAFLLGIYLVASLWNPCDSTSVALGSSLILIVLGMALGLLSSIDALVRESNPFWHRFGVCSVLFFVVWLGIASYVSIGTTNARVTLLGFWQVIALLGLAKALLRVMRVRALRTTVMRWQIGLGVGVCGYALFQYLISMPATRDRFVIDRVRMLEQVGIADGTPEAMQFENRLFSSEPTGTFALTNSLAGYIAPLIVILFLLGLCSTVRPIGKGASDNTDRSLSKRWSVILSSCFMILFVVLFLTKSRTAWIATAAGLASSFLLLLLRIPKERRSALYFAGLGLGIVFIIGFAVIAWKDPLIVVEAWKSLTYRYEYWRGATQIGFEHPFVGTGPLSFQTQYASVKAITASENPADPHNMWMEGLVWGGFPLLLSMVGVACALVVSIARCKSMLWNEEDESLSSIATTSESSSICRTLDWGAWLALLAVMGWALLIYSVNGDSDGIGGAFLFCGLGALVAWALGCAPFASAINGNFLGTSTLLILVVSIHFLFSGGWMQPGPMGLMICGVAGVVACSSRDAKQMAPSNMTWKVGRLTCWILTLMVFAKFTLYPELARNRLEDRLRSNGLSTLSIEECELQLLANTIDPDIAMWIVRYSHEQAMNPKLGASARKAWLHLFDRSALTWVQRDRKNWIVHSQLGIMEGMIADAILGVGMTSQVSPVRESALEDLGKRYIKSAKERFEITSSLFPSSLANHLQLAVVSVWDGNFEVAKKHLEVVAEIDRLTPHLDRKLTATTVWVPRSIPGEAWDLPKSDRIDSMPGYVKGEPVFSRLRKLIP